MNMNTTHSDQQRGNRDNNVLPFVKKAQKPNEHDRVFDRSHQRRERPAPAKMIPDNCGKAPEKEPDDELEKFGQELDVMGATIGLIVADLFKTVTMAAAKLPEMELHSDLIDVTFDGNSISVSVTGLGGMKGKDADDEDGDAQVDPKARKIDVDELHDFFFGGHTGMNHDDDEEEGIIYDGD